MHWVAKLKDWKELLSRTSRFGLRPDLPVTVLAKKQRVYLQAQDGALCFRFSAPAQVKKAGLVALPLMDLLRTTRGRAAELTVERRGGSVVFTQGQTFTLTLTPLARDAVVEKMPTLTPNLKLTRDDLDVILRYLDVGTAHFHGQLVGTLAVEARPLKKGTAFILTDTFSGVMYRSARAVTHEEQREKAPVQIPRTLLSLAQHLVPSDAATVPLFLSPRRVACFGEHGDFYQSPAIELSPVKDMPATLKSLRQTQPDCVFAVSAPELRQALEDLVAAVDKPTTVSVRVEKDRLRMTIVGGPVQAHAVVPLVKKVAKPYKFTGAVLVMLAVVRPWGDGAPLTFRVFQRKLIWVTGEEPHHVDYLIPTAT